MMGFSKHEIVIEAVLKTIRRISFSKEGKKIFSADHLYQYIEKLTEIPSRAYLRKHFLMSIADVAALDDHLATEQLPNLINSDTLEEMDQVADCFVGIFLRERLKLSGASHEFYFQGRNYPVWLNVNERPLTSIEESLYKWVTSANTVMHRLAVIALLKIAEVFEIREKATINAFLEAMREEEEEPPVLFYEIDQKEKIAKLSFWYNIKLSFLLLFVKSANKKVIKSLVALLIRKGDRFGKQHYEAVFQKLSNSTDENTAQIGRRMRRIFR